MDHQKIADLAKSFSLSCKEAVKDSQLGQKLTSPAVALVALTVLEVIVGPDGEIKRGPWSFGG